MRFFLLIIITLFSTALLANTEISTQIHDVDLGNESEDTLVFLTSGDVVRLKSFEKSLIAEAREILRKRVWVKILYNPAREIIDIEEISPPLTSFVQKSFFLEETPTVSVPYTPTILKNMDEARSFFYDVRTNHKESQCYNRAHAWSYDWRTKRNLYSSKVWLFFTKKFIRKYKFEWWFHVAPMVHVNVDGEVKDRVMDIKYARGPIKLKSWTDIFMRDNANCPVVEKYSDHANFPESGSCFVMKSSMYYYQPVDLELLEIKGTEKTKWIESEVKQAFLEALEITL